MATIAPSRVDIGDLAAFVKLEAAERFARGIVEASTACRDNDMPLDENQEKEFFESALWAFDGFEREVASHLAREFDRKGVPFYGLPDVLADVGLMREDDDA